MPRIPILKLARLSKYWPIEDYLPGGNPSSLTLSLPRAKVKMETKLADREWAVATTGYGQTGAERVAGSLEAVQLVLRSGDPYGGNGAVGSFSGKSRKLLLQTTQQHLDWQEQFAVWKTLLSSGIPQLVQVAKTYPIPLRPVKDIRDPTGERDFRWADLRRANLSQLDLRGVDLSGASLSRARLSQVNLSHVSLIGANLSQADLSGADLRGANLKGANLMGANLIGANLRGANLADANLKWVVISPETQIDRKWQLVWEIVNGHAQGKNLAQADLREANLDWADLRGANLAQADLRGARLVGANLQEVDLQGADLRWASLERANLSGADLSAACLQLASLRGAILSPETQIDPKWRLVWEIVNGQANVKNLSEADLRVANLSEANLSRANLSGADLSQANLSQADLRGANLQGSNLRRARLKGALVSAETQMDPKWRLVWEIVNGQADVKNLSEADLRVANLSGADLSGANLSWADLRVANLSEANLSGANLSGADLRGANLDGTDLRGANLKDAKLSFGWGWFKDLTGTILPDGRVHS